MIKTFIVWTRIDNTWTGGRIEHHDNFSKQIDLLINTYAKENKLKVVSVSYSFANEEINHGSKEFHTEKRSYFIASVCYRKQLSIFWGKIKL